MRVKFHMHKVRRLCGKKKERKKKNYTIRGHRQPEVAVLRQHLKCARRGVWPWALKILSVIMAGRLIFS